MSLDTSLLINPRLVGDKLISQCPACAEDGGDKSGEHLCVFDEGKGAFSCIAHQSDHLHRQRIFAIAGSKVPRGAKRRLMPRRPPRRNPAPRYLTNTEIPALCVPTDGQLEAIARQRGWDVGVALVPLRTIASRGLLWVGSLHGEDCWIVTDSCHFNWRARRMDGGAWKTRNGAPKSITKGKQLSGWPVGTDTVGRHQYPFVALCEGEVDLLASAVIAYAEGRDLSKIGFVAMLGAVAKIDPAALKEFAGKTVLVMRQNDVEHQKSAKVSQQWCLQLHEGGARKLGEARFDKISLPAGAICKDAGDYAKSLNGPTVPRFFGTFPALQLIGVEPDTPLAATETLEKEVKEGRESVIFPAGMRPPKDMELCRLDLSLSRLGEWVFDRSGDTFYSERLGAYIAIGALSSLWAA
jgi:hypothetical protein